MPWSLSHFELTSTPEQSSQHSQPLAAHLQTANSLRVMNQHVRTLASACEDSPFLSGHPCTCVDGLEWFARFAQDTVPLSLETYGNLNELLALCAKTQGVSPMEAGFDLHRHVAKPQRELTQLILEQNFPGEMKEYEIDVCAYMMANPKLTYSQWLHDFPRWRQAGLYYPLCLASIYMPTSDCWLPECAWGTPLACWLDNTLQALRSHDEDHSHSRYLSALAGQWSEDETDARAVLASVMDRLAVLMGVRSNAMPIKDDFDLSRSLAKFARAAKPASLYEDLHAHNYRIYPDLQQLVQDAFPPSLLYAPLVNPKRPTWGYSNLRFGVWSEKNGFPVVVTLLSYDFERVDPDPSSVAHTYTPAHLKKYSSSQTSQRLQEVLWRLGEVACSPEVRLCMDHPHLALATLSAPTTDVTLSTLMPGASDTRDAEEAYLAYTQSLDRLMPAPVMSTYPDTQHLLMWRLDIPPRAIVYTGTDADVDPASHAQHHLPKILVNTKANARPVGGILLSPDKPTEATVRGCLKTFAATELPSHPSNTVLVTQHDAVIGANRVGPIAPVTCTTLAESVACFSLHVPEAITVCALGESCAWKEDSIDPRYAEVQVALNGFRLRDWAAMHIGKAGTQQSRLASHSVSYDTLYTVSMPWMDQDNATRWVKVASTLPVDGKVLSGPSLKKAVESRFLHDLKMLPTVGGEKVDKHNCEIYTDASGSVGIAYAEKGGTSLQFVLFQPLPASQ